MQQRGKVIFVGAGPGDPGLLTMNAVKALQKAEVVIADRLVSEEILTEYVPFSAQIIGVGKQGGSNASAPQTEINELLVAKALSYNYVVRLKGGDTSMFSNILDEILALKNAGISYEIIPGITALSGAAAYTGIPLTARNYATGVRILTYYTHTAIEPEAWHELAQMNDTLVFYMSCNALPEVVKNLLHYGADAATPFVVTEQATTPNQHVHTYTLQQFANTEQPQHFISPSLVIIGKVTALYKAFAWLPNANERVPYFAPLDTMTELFNDIKKEIMLAEHKLKIFRELITGATKEELIWMSGYITALAENNGAALPATQTAVAQSTLAACTVVYGTESGNSKKVAVDVTSKLKKQGVQVKTKSLDQYKVSDLQKENCLLVVMSTQGDGEPPAAAKKFYDYILQTDVQLDKLKYGVLALGDSSYPLFCKAGEDVDERLQKLGAERIIPMGKCDTDFEPEAHAWIDELITSTLQAAPLAAPAAVKTKPVSSGKKIHKGAVVTSINLNDFDSAKETYHIEIATDEPIVYEPGDSIGIIAKNSDAAVSKILELLETEPTQLFEFKSNNYTAAELFKHKINIQYLPERIILQYAALIQKEIPSIRMDLADLLRIYPYDSSLNAQQLISILDPVAPRLYSISSSPAAHGENEVHITVSKSAFEVDSQKRFGLCSDYLSCMNVDDALEIYVQKNTSFKLPDADTDIIMIGPGTGIAPFRSFLFERDILGAQGRNWLFFGDQHFVSDFLYQTELLTFFETGTLTRINTAFSRDQKEKLYVQHRMLQQSTELWNWIQTGASIYVCGAKYPMSTDVENMLLQIIQTKGSMSEEEAAHYLNEMSEHGKYHKDVY